MEAEERRPMNARARKSTRPSQCCAGNSRSASSSLSASAGRLRSASERTSSARLGDRVEPRQIGAALRFYTSDTEYRRAQRAGAPRIDLDGNQCGTVSEADAASAAAEVAKRKTAAAKK